MEVMVPVRSVYLCQDHDIQQDDSVRGIDHNHDEYEHHDLDPNHDVLIIQGAAAPGKGRAGQCKTSADCASRVRIRKTTYCLKEEDYQQFHLKVPYCSELGFCHGGR